MFPSWGIIGSRPRRGAIKNSSRKRRGAMVGGGANEITE
jgi:hypothetical protein